MIVYQNFFWQLANFECRFFLQKSEVNFQRKIWIQLITNISQEKKESFSSWMRSHFSFQMRALKIQKHRFMKSPFIYVLKMISWMHLSPLASVYATMQCFAMVHSIFSHKYKYDVWGQEQAIKTNANVNLHITSYISRHGQQKCAQEATNTIIIYQMQE